MLYHEGILHTVRAAKCHCDGHRRQAARTACAPLQPQQSRKSPAPNQQQLSPYKATGSNASIVMMLLPRITCNAQEDFVLTLLCNILHVVPAPMYNALCNFNLCQTCIRQCRVLELVSERQGAPVLASTHHHADINLVFDIHSVVQHDIHELIKATECATDLPVCI